MPIELTKEAGAKSLFIHVSGMVVKADYENFVPEFEQLVAAHGKWRVLFDVTELSGWDAGALWEEIKFDVKHLSDFERIAVIGDQKWAEVMTSLCRPFAHAELRYFDEDHIEEARKWLDNPARKELVY